MRQVESNCQLLTSLSSQLRSLITKATALSSWYGYLEDSATTHCKPILSESSYLKATSSLIRLERSLIQLTLIHRELESRYPIGKQLSSSYQNFLNIVGVGNTSEKMESSGLNEPNCPVENFEQLELFSAEDYR